MKINNKPAQSRTLVLGVNESGEIDLPWGSMPIRFKTDESPPRIDLINGELVFINMDNVLGTTAAPTLKQGGQSITFNVALWSMGDPVVMRVIHYTWY